MDRYFKSLNLKNLVCIRVCVKMELEGKKGGGGGTVIEWVILFGLESFLSSVLIKPL